LRREWDGITGSPLEEDNGQEPGDKEEGRSVRDAVKGQQLGNKEVELGDGRGEGGLTKSYFCNNYR
jgi:hypothetical protein